MAEWIESLMPHRMKKRRDSTVGCLFLGFLSLQFDFGSCINPSRERPYFFQGRLMIGAMIPFALLYVYGLHRLLRSVSTLVLLALVAIVMVITISGFSANDVAFASVYNWFHM